MTATLISVAILFLLVFAYRQRLVKYSSASASRLFKMMDRVNASPDSLLGKRDNQSVLKLIDNCKACEDHMACDTYLQSEGKDCPSFCPNRKELEASEL